MTAERISSKFQIVVISFFVCVCVCAEGDGRKAGGAPLSLPKVRRNPLIEIIAISTGCLNQCTYCKTKHARGDLGSYPPEEIVARAEQVKWAAGTHVGVGKVPKHFGL